MDSVELRKIIDEIIANLLSKGFIEDDNDSYISESDSIS
jgi:hypothetical protein